MPHRLLKQRCCWRVEQDLQVHTLLAMMAEAFWMCLHCSKIEQLYWQVV